MRLRHTMVGVAVFATVLAGLAGTSGAAPSTAKPDPDATIRIGLAFPANGLDPHRVSTPGEQPYTFLIYDRLTQLDNKLAVKPMLATSWSYSPDGTQLTMTLRKGVSFHDGTPFDSAAVVANINRAKTIAGSTAATTLDAVTGVEAVNPNTVRFDLAYAKGAAVPALLAGSAGEMISPKAIADTSAANLLLDPKLAGSGPFVVTKFQPGVEVDYERAPGKYWDKTAGKAKQIDMTFVASGPTRIAGVQSGQFDLVQTVGNDVTASKAVVASGQAEGTPNYTFTPVQVWLNPTHPPLDNPAVREAITYAIDKKSIAKNLLDDNCAPQNQLYPKGNPYHASDVENLTSYNVDKAKSVLSKAGVEPFSMSMGVAAGSVYDPMATVIQDELSKIGITVDVQRVPQAQTNVMFNSGALDAQVQTLAAQPDPSGMLSAYYLGGANLIGKGPDRADIQVLADKGLDPRTTPAERNVDYQKVFAAIAKGYYSVPICINAHLWLHNSKVIDPLKTTPWLWAGLPDFRNISMTK